MKSELWKFDCTLSNRPRNSNTHGQLDTQAFGQCRKTKSGPYELQYLASYSQCKLKSLWGVEFRLARYLIFYHGEMDFFKTTWT